jgi:hypothetical protein
MVKKKKHKKNRVDERTINVISTGCFMNDTKMLISVLKFFLGTTRIKEEETKPEKIFSPTKESNAKELIRKNFNLHSKKTKKQKTLLKKAKKVVILKIKKDDQSTKSKREQ